eukprot:scaffold73385_cov31-Tisochrysis_lutea.AAC.2
MHELVVTVRPPLPKFAVRISRREEPQDDSLTVGGRGVLCRLQPPITRPLLGAGVHKCSANVSVSPCGGEVQSRGGVVVRDKNASTNLDELSHELYTALLACCADKSARSTVAHTDCLRGGQARQAPPPIDLYRNAPRVSDHGTLP